MITRKDKLITTGLCRIEYNIHGLILLGYNNSIQCMTLTSAAKIDTSFAGGW